MLSSTKSTALLFLLLAILSTRNAAFQLRQTYETTTVTVDETPTLTPTPTPPPPTTAITTKKSMQSSAPSQQQITDYGKSVKIFFPSTNDSEEESKYDIYGLKTTPPPNVNKIQAGDTLNTTTEATMIETTTTSTTGFKASNSTRNATIESIDDRLGILNLAPKCPEGHVIFNQHCHAPA